MSVFCKSLFCWLLVSSLLMSSANANDSASPFYEFDRHTVIATVFASSFLQPEVANIYGFSRGKNKGLINVSVVNRPLSGNMVGLAAKLSGTATNLMQQKTVLDFVEISDGPATYYLAPFNFINEEIVHLDVNVEVGGEIYNIKVTKKLYVDR